METIEVNGLGCARVPGPGAGDLGPAPKVCNRCGQPKPIDQFRLKTTRGDRAGDRVAHCNDCRPKDKNRASHWNKYNNKKSIEGREIKLKMKRILLEINQNYYKDIIEQRKLSRMLRAREYQKHYYNSDVQCYKKAYYRKIMLEHVRELERRRGHHRKRKESNLITDTYIKNIITTNSILKFCDVPSPLVELKRSLIRLKRELSKEA